VRGPSSLSPRSLAVIHLAFFASGFSAVIYQLIWQRVLFGLYGASAESVTVVVAIFMAGLGVGSLAGGWLADRTPAPLWRMFVGIEIAIGAFGLCSVALFRWVGSATLTIGPEAVWLVVAALLFPPTALMGATLPILTSFVSRTSGRLGTVVGWLYGVNTLGSAVGAVLTVLFVAGNLGQQGSVQFAAILNICAAGSVLWWKPRS
jgi:predicted membrane-bound spermidine synthase